MTVTVEGDSKVVEKETGPYEAEIVSVVDGDTLTSVCTATVYTYKHTQQARTYVFFCIPNKFF